MPRERVADLHTHTYHSDGTRSPKEVVDVARAAGIEILSISDHDNLAAYYEIQPYAESQGVQLIPGIELSCGYNGIDVHILAYSFDAHDERIATRLQGFRDMRQRRGQRIVEKLRELGYDIRPERVDELAAGGAVGRPHVARALVEAGHASSVSDTFDKLLGNGKPAYIDKDRFSIEEAVTLIHSAGGYLSIAHPTLYPDYQNLVPALLDLGIDAIEIRHPDVGDGARKHLRDIARFRGKFTTGGSDDHGTVKTKETLGTVRVPESAIEMLLK